MRGRGCQYSRYSSDHPLLILYYYFLWLFDGQNSSKNDQVRHNNIMTQMASLLAVAAVFIGLWTSSKYLHFTVI